MSLRLVAAPVAYPISLAEAKTHLRVTRDDQDAYIEALIAAAFDHIEKSTGRAFVEQTWEMIIDAFPTGEIAIPIGPVASVVSVTYADADGLAQIVPEEAYEVDTASETGWVVPVGDWPTPMATINAVVITFTVGGGILPADIRHAALLLLGLWYDTAAAATADPMTEVPLAFEALAGLHRRYYV